MKGKGGGIVGDGEIIQVQGGHIIRATGRKDRHSKVYTAKGPRDRRVRLSAHTAIQFYDVQDRLGYDRPSKAVDWLMKKAKDAIDKLADNSPNCKGVNVIRDQGLDHSSPGVQELGEQQESSSARYALEVQSHLLIGESSTNSSVMGADSMKPFFPLTSGTSLMEMQSFPHDRISRIGEDLGLSLHTIQQDHNLSQHRSSNYTEHDQMLLQASNPIGFEQNYTKSESWNSLAGEGENRVGFIFNSHAIPHFDNQNSAAFSQREPLQSNYSNLLHSWNERMLPSVDQQNAQAMNQSSMYNIYFGSNFQVPARIHGEDEHSPISQL